MNKDYACTAPFSYSEITNDGQYLCCPGWLPTDVNDTDNFKDNFHSNKSNEIRESILDGSYKFCKENLCPHLSSFKKGNIPSAFKPKTHPIFKNPKLNWLTFGFDLSCNLGCPSCRSEFINFVGEKRIQMDKIMDTVIEQLGSELVGLSICGGAEPFFSKTMMRFMREFDASKFPKLKKIHLHTNGTLWNENAWKAITPVHKYISTCEISMDAGTREVYNIVRLGGDWDKLMNNIDFVLTIPTIKSIQFSFVVQQRNYKDMKNFYNLIQSIMKGSDKRFTIFFNPIVEWGEFEQQDNFKEQEIHNPSHSEHSEFLKVLKSVHRKPNVIHSFDGKILLKKSII
jgi:organic radical activating enzyme